MVDKSQKFMVLESVADGRRCIVATDFPFDPKLFEVCGYGPTRQACYALLFIMKPASNPPIKTS